MKQGYFIEQGKRYLTKNGNVTIPTPKLTWGPRATTNTFKRIEKWLVSNCINEAKTLGDKYNLLLFELILERQNKGGMSKADKQLCLIYLWEEDRMIEQAD